MPDGVEIRGPRRAAPRRSSPRRRSRSSPTLQREFGARRGELLARRAERRGALRAGELPGLPRRRRASVREGDWRVAAGARRTCATAASRSPARSTAR